MVPEAETPRHLGFPEAPIRRLTVPAAIAGIVLCIPIGSGVLAKTHPQTDSADSAAIEPAATDALNKMGVYLRSLKSFQVQGEITMDDVLEDGQIIQSSKKVDVVAARPDRLRVETTGQGQHRLFFFDGKNFTIFAEGVNYYATVPAPSTIGELIEQVNAKYAVELPLVDLFQWGTDDEVVKRLKGAMDVGPSEVDGITCEQYAFHQERADWQIWIQLGDFPLPRKLVIRTLTDEARPQYSEILTWNLAPSFSDDAFTFTPPPGALPIKMGEVNTASNQK